MNAITLRRPRAGAFVPGLCLLLIGLVVSGCDRSGQRRELAGTTMGTTWSVVYADPGTVSPDALQTLIEAELEQLNDSLSTYLADSEISRLNARWRASAESAADEPTPQPAAAVPVSEEFATVLDAALGVAKSSDGAYDVTVGPLIELWGFGASGSRSSPPSAAEIAEARSRVGWQRLGWDPSQRLLAKPSDVYLDFSSLAKGYAVDRVFERLREAGVERLLVEIGGELRAGGERPGGGPWRLAVESPQPAGQRFVETLALTAAAVATSGDYRNYFEADGQRFSHLVDPRTGYPVAHDLVSVTVVSDTCLYADAWATALIVLGREAAMRVAREQGLAVLLVAREGDQLALDYTPEFTSYLPAAADES